MNDTFPINIENFLKVIIMAVWTAIMFLYRYFTGIELGRGMPKVTWVARGLNDYGKRPVYSPILLSAHSLCSYGGAAADKR